MDCHKVRQAQACSFVISSKCDYSIDGVVCLYSPDYCSNQSSAKQGLIIEESFKDAVLHCFRNSASYEQQIYQSSFNVATISDITSTEVLCNLIKEEDEKMEDPYCP